MVGLIHKFWILYYYFQAGLFWKGVLNSTSSLEGRLSRAEAIGVVCNYLADCKAYKSNLLDIIEVWNNSKANKETKNYINNILQGVSNGKSLVEAIRFANFITKYK